ncbi:hypothetical protein TBLA_0B08300 [Henningerozyma blattae CBS 6284]|uniref:CNH domain-containing protein n=1 Tax=Henningerozyma blattae (strain ATCC 34711 / CBS 6284 / DSM 70876 / NBRC 10599 / NRRL Y-10934 / UCD 77-7) TaxID=1071380 RepID=I2GZU3_HENB6|nr:hypothetical protein TBLA_0B08300 [Tetrapisispora blattae CBS 6284]CCH59645.1 hypothetical protein TBLA_0B08300 [Tetrapisispora blattae CBS 6284]
MARKNKKNQSQSRNKDKNKSLNQEERGKTTDNEDQKIEKKVVITKPTDNDDDNDDNYDDDDDDNDDAVSHVTNRKEDKTAETIDVSTLPDESTEDHSNDYDNGSSTIITGSSSVNLQLLNDSSSNSMPQILVSTSNDSGNRNVPYNITKDSITFSEDRSSGIERDISTVDFLESSDTVDQKEFGESLKEIEYDSNEDSLYLSKESNIIDLNEQKKGKIQKEDYYDEKMKEFADSTTHERQESKNVFSEAATEKHLENKKEEEIGEDEDSSKEESAPYSFVSQEESTNPDSGEVTAEIQARSKSDSVSSKKGESLQTIAEIPSNDVSDRDTINKLTEEENNEDYDKSVIRTFKSTDSKDTPKPNNSDDLVEPGNNNNNNNSYDPDVSNIAAQADQNDSPRSSTKVEKQLGSAKEQVEDSTISHRLTNQDNDTLKRDDHMELESGKEEVIEPVIEPELSRSEGPFKYYQIISDLPKDMKYTCLDAYQGNIYLGTTEGDLLHYFEIEPNNYILVSQTKFDQNKNSPIDRFLFLPKIERALVLSGGKLTLFLLPEFAPAPNIPNIGNVNDITLKSYSEKTSGYSVYAFKNGGFIVLRISEKSMISSKKYDLKGVTKGAAHDSILMVSRDNTYEIIDTGLDETIQLFRVSENKDLMKPIILSFNDSEFLIVSGGTSIEDTAMGLVVDHHGNIVHGTLILDRYPKNIVIKFPYLFIDYGQREISVYNVSSNEEPILLQTLKSTGKSLSICESSEVFNGFINKDLKNKVMNFLVQKPIYFQGNEYPSSNLYDETTSGDEDISNNIQKQKSHIENIFEKKSSLAIYGDLGVHILSVETPLLRFDDINDQQSHEIKKYIQDTQSEKNSPFKQLENRYLLTLRLILLLNFEEIIDENVIKKWCKYIKKVNILLLFYIFNLKVYGDIWCYTGLQDLVFTVKEQKVVESKCPTIIKILKGLGEFVKLQREKIESAQSKKKDVNIIQANDLFYKNYTNIKKTIDMAIVNLSLEKDEKLTLKKYAFDVDNFKDIIDIVENSKSEKQEEFLLQIYKLTGNISKALELLQKQKKYIDLLNYIEANIIEINRAYKEDEIVNEFVFIISGLGDDIKTSTIESILSLLTICNIKRDRLIMKLEDNVEIKVFILEEMGIEDNNERTFMLEYYIVKLEKEMKDQNLWESIGIWLSEYSNDLNYNKKKIEEYLKIKMESSETDFGEFLIIFNNICNVCFSEKDRTKEDEDDREEIEFISKFYKCIKKIDINHILSLLMCFKLTNNNYRNDLLSNEEIFKIKYDYFDFIGVEDFISKDNLLKILKNYIDIHDKINRFRNINKFLKRNYNCFKDDPNLLLEILKIIPKDIPLKLVGDLLYYITRKYETNRTEQTIKKELLKSEIQQYNDIIKCLTDGTNSMH